MKNINAASMTPDEIRTYKKDYSDGKFWNKLAHYASQAGKSVVRLALILYYELKDPNVSLTEKGVIIGALGYFILPADLIPDGIPVVGFTDDLTALKAAYDFVRSNITPETLGKADDKLEEWFG